jgi:tetratricopeptide (TPR) repeat protein
MQDLVGTRLGDFEIVRELGRGGMGVVYEARQVSLNRQVALKVLSGGLGLTSKAVQRFRREAEAAARLHHTNIVPVYATSEEQGVHFYAMELIDGASLDYVIRRLRSGPDSNAGSASPASAAARLSEAMSILREAMRLAELNGERHFLPRLPNMLGWLHGELYDLETAVRLDAESARLGREFGAAEAEANAQVNLSHDYLELGDPACAFEHLQAAKRLFDQDVWFRWRYYLRLQAELARYWITRGDLKAAASHADVTTKAQLEAHRLAATAHFLRARDRCPIMAEPQLQLALGADLFATSDGRDKYWARVMELVRNDSLLWFLLGVEHLREGRIDETCQNWRRSLELSDRWLAEIVSRSRGRMEASEILRRVLPDDPERVVRAAEQLFPGLETKSAALQRPFWEKALALLDKGRDALRGSELRLRGRIQARLGRVGEARQSYRAAVSKEPSRLDAASTSRKQPVHPPPSFTTLNSSTLVPCFSSTGPTVSRPSGSRGRRHW